MLHKEDKFIDYNELNYHLEINSYLSSMKHAFVQLKKIKVLD